MILIGAQQTASEVERRIVANSAIRVVGRLDPAEASRPEYGFLPAGPAPAGAARQAGHHVRQPARHPGAARAWSSRSRPGRPGPPRPGRGAVARRCARSPSPPTRSRWSAPAPAAARPTTTSRSERRPAPMKILHTSDWHVGKVLKGQSRADEHTAVLAEVVEIARAEQPDLVIVAGDLYDTAAPTPEATRLVTRALTALRRHRRGRGGDRRQPRQRPGAGRAAAVGRGGRHHAARRRPGQPGRARHRRRHRRRRAVAAGRAAVPVPAVRGARVGDVRADRRRGQPDLRRPPGPAARRARPRASTEPDRVTWSPPT